MLNFDELKELIISGNTDAFLLKVNLPLNPEDLNVLKTRDVAYRCSLLDWAAINNRQEIVQLLSIHVPALLESARQRPTPIHYAARHGSLESLKFLLNQSRDKTLLEHKDYDGKTALDLAIQHGCASCVRTLINFGAKLPTEIQPLLTLINLSQCILYRESGGVYQLLIQEEINYLDSQKSLENLSLQKKTSPLSLIRKPYCLPITLYPVEDTLLKLIDKYCYLLNRTDKEAREQKHSSPGIDVERRLSLSRQKRESLLKIIRLLVLATPGQHNLQANLLQYDFEAECYLKPYLSQKQVQRQRYFGDDLSVNSDSEDESTYFSSIDDTTTLFSLTPDLTKFNQQKATNYHKTVFKFSSSFWNKTRLDTPKHVGLKNEVTAISQMIKNGSTQARHLSELPKITKKLISGLVDRGTIEYQGNMQWGTQCLNAINQCKPDELEALLKKLPPIFVLGTRGINYMLDRWNADARRYHRRINESQQPQFSEAVLKTLPYDYYTDLGPTHDFHRNNDENLALQQEALRLETFLQSLNETGPCIAYSRNHKEPYLFNNVGDCFQDHFSNGVNEHLEDLAHKRRTYPAYWGVHLKNSFNPSMAIGSRPYHALKYTFNLKPYYPRAMGPRYWNDGTLEYSHVGKVYLSLHPLQEILSKNGPHNLSMQDRQARVSIDDQISPEKELSFLSFMPGDRVFHQFVAKFPSFKTTWKKVHLLKYGLDRESYEAFRHLISITQLGSLERNQLITLLSEWLCSYHEVLLIEIAKEEALKRGGILAYVNREGKLTLEPESGRIFTKGEGENKMLRDEVHILRTIRTTLASTLSGGKHDTQTVPGFTLVNIDQSIQTLQSFLGNANALSTLAGKTTTKLSSYEEAVIFNRTQTVETIKIAKSQQVINQLLKQGLYARPSMSLKKQINYMTDASHLYTDLEISTLLNQIPVAHAHVYAAQHPLIQGELGEEARQLFVDLLKNIFKAKQRAVIPIEISQENLNQNAYLHMNGIHWNGIGIFPTGDNQFRVELMDPINSLAQDTDITILSQNNHGPALARLCDLLRQAATETHVNIQIRGLRTQQQAGDLDCGAWTVDNLIRRSQNQPLRTRAEITGVQLREDHNAIICHNALVI